VTEQPLHDALFFHNFSTFLGRKGSTSKTCEAAGLQWSGAAAASNGWCWIGTGVS
jgi:hypothetical protein